MPKAKSFLQPNGFLRTYHYLCVFCRRRRGRRKKKRWQIKESKRRKNEDAEESKRREGGLGDILINRRSLPKGESLGIVVLSNAL